MVRGNPSFCPYCGNELTKRHFDGRERNYCTGCESYIWRDSAPCAAAVVIDESSCDRRFLLVRRSIPPGKGRWSFPAGHIETDEKPERGAVRKLREETGIEVSPEDLDLFNTALLGRDIYALHIGYTVEYDSTEGKIDVSSSDETSEAKFWTYQEFKESSEEPMPQPLQNWLKNLSE